MENNKAVNYTDHLKIVMVNTTKPGNLGAAARAMKNMGLSKLCLVNPRNYPSAEATARASGADDILAAATVKTSLAEALSGVDLVIGASARQRSVKWQQLDVVESCHEAQKTIAEQGEVAVVFGTENSGLTNAELDLCQILMTIPSNPDYSSLNVASAIQVFAYQNFTINTPTTFTPNANPPAGNAELQGFYQHLEQALTHLNYFHPKRPKDLLMRRLRRFFNRTTPEKEELAIFRGILHSIKPFK